MISVNRFPKLILAKEYLRCARLPLLFFKKALPLLVLMNPDLHLLAEQKPVQVNLGSASGQAGERITVPLTLSKGSQADVRKISMQVIYPSHLLTFFDLKKGPAMTPADTMDFKVMAADSGQEAILSIELLSPASLKPGTFASMEFEISRNVPVARTIRLKNDDPRVYSNEGLVLPTRGRDGFVDVAGGAPVAPCFFYMH